MVHSVKRERKGQVYFSEENVRNAVGDLVFECLQYHGGDDIFPPSGGDSVDACGWGCWSRSLFLEVEDAAEEVLFREEEGIT